MASVAVYRNDSAGRSLLRSQPAAGFDSRTVIDYECPYGEVVTYDWTVTYTDPSVYSTVWNELWASLAAWTVDSGAFDVSGGTARNNATGSGKAHRSLTFDRYRVTVASLNSPLASRAVEVWLLASGTGVESLGYVRLAIDDGTALLRVDVYKPGVINSQASTAIDPTHPITVDLLDGSVAVTGTGGSRTVLAGLAIARVEVRYGNTSTVSQVSVGAIKVESYPTPTPLSETSSLVTLSPDDAWLIHPGTPGLSIGLSNTDQSVAGITAIAPVVNESNTTVHNILGSATPVPTTTGPRGDDKTGLTVWTNTSAERAALRALLASDIPILIQIPPSWEADFNCGFYQVGNVNETRDSDQIRFSASSRTHELPLIKVQSPVVDVENSGWSYAAAAAEFASYTALAASFATYADLASNTRT